MLIAYSDSPGVTIKDAFLSEEECDQLLALAKRSVAGRYSVVTSLHSAQRISVGYGGRSGYQFEFPYAETPELEEIYEKAAALCGLPVVNAEPLSICSVLPYSGSDPLHNAFQEGAAERSSEKGGQRVASLVLFLDAAQGAGHNFPSLQLSIGAVTGRAVVFGNVNAENNPHPLAVYQRLLPNTGESWIMELHFREARRPGQIPKVTDDGFRTDSIPTSLFTRLQAYYQEQRSSSVAEESDAIGRYILGDELPSKMIQLTEDLEEAVVGGIRPIIESWSGFENLSFAACYGIREYQRGAVLKAHRDREGSHILSAILNIAQEVEEDWPLQIDDHSGCRRQVVLAPGEMVLYESARLLHGRETKLNGDTYANIFVHFQPNDWV